MKRLKQLFKYFIEFIGGKDCSVIRIKAMNSTRNPKMTFVSAPIREELRWAGLVTDDQ